MYKPEFWSSVEVLAQDLDMFKVLNYGCNCGFVIIIDIVESLLRSQKLQKP